MHPFGHSTFVIFVHLVVNFFGCGLLVFPRIGKRGFSDFNNYHSSFILSE